MSTTLKRASDFTRDALLLSCWSTDSESCEFSKVSLVFRLGCLRKRCYVIDLGIPCCYIRSKFPVDYELVVLWANERSLLVS